MNKVANKEDKQILGGEGFSMPGKSLHLSVEVREHEILCCLLDKHSNCYIAWSRVKIAGKEDSVEKLLDDSVLSTEASSVSVVFAQNSSILVPAPFFKKELVNDYLGLQQLAVINETPCFDYIKNLDSYNLYTVNSRSLDVMQKKYPGASFRHTSSVFIEFVLLENKHLENSVTFVSVYNNYFDALVLKEGKLTLSNRFYYSTPNDFIFHILWVYDQLGLDNEKVPVIFYGEIEPGSDAYALANKYLGKVSLGGKNGQSGYDKALSVIPPHKYRSLFTQYLCV